MRFLASLLCLLSLSTQAQVSYWFQGFQRQGNAALARAYLGVGTNSLVLTGSVAVAVGPRLTGVTNLNLITISAPDMATTNYANSVTNGYPWGALYDPAGSAQGATNPITLRGVSAGTDITMTTNAGVVTINSTATAASSAVAAATNITVLTNGNLYTVGVTGLVHTTGDTVSGPIFTTSSSTNSPQHDELVTAEWVRSLLVNGQVLYNSTNLAPGRVYSAQPFLYITNIPFQFSRVYSSLTNNQYVGAVAITNQLTLSGPIVVSAFLGTFGGSANSAISVRPEIYYSYDNGTNLFGDWEAQAQPLDTINGGGITNRYDFVIPVPQTTFTAPATVYRVFRVTSVSGTPNKPSLAVCGGTNTPGQISVYQPQTATIASTFAVAPGANVTVTTNGNVFTVASSGSSPSTGSSTFGNRRVSYFEQDSYPGSFHASLGMSPNVVGNVQRFAANSTTNTHNLLWVINQTQCTVSDTYANFIPSSKPGLFRFVVAPTNTTLARIWVGLVDNYQGNYIWNVENSVTNTLAAFHLYTNQANWYFVTCDGSASTPTDTGIPAVQDGMETMDIQNYGSYWVGTVRGVSVTNNTHLPAVPMSPVISVWNLDGTKARGLRVWGYYGETDW